MEGWVDLGALITPNIEPTTARSEVRHLTAAPPRHVVRIRIINKTYLYLLTLVSEYNGRV